jgi:hypothetical protein
VTPELLALSARYLEVTMRTPGAITAFRDVRADHVRHESGHRSTHTVVRFDGTRQGTRATDDVKAGPGVLDGCHSAQGVENPRSAINPARKRAP